MENNFPDKSDDFLDVGTPDSLPPDDVKLVHDPNDPKITPPKVDYDSIGEFCFESEQLALKGNDDYKNLIQRIVVLKAQKHRALKDIEILKDIKERATNDPIQLLEDMKHKRIKFPLPAQKPPPLPEIDWSKYAVNEDPEQFAFRMRAELAKKRVNKPSCTITSSSSYCKDSSMSCNWSTQELNRLKELLIEYPSEQDEEVRWEKIARALQTRTPFEVATRIFNYFSEYTENTIYSVNKAPDLEVLKKIWQLNEIEEKQDVKALKVDPRTLSDDEDIGPELRNTPEYEELKILRRVLRRKMMELPANSGLDASKQRPKRCAEKRPFECVDNDDESNQRKRLMDEDYLSSGNVDPDDLPANNQRKRLRGEDYLSSGNVDPNDLPEN